MKQVFIVLLLMCSVLSYGQELYTNAYQIGDGYVWFFMSDDGEFSFESTAKEVAYQSPEDSISIPNNVWYKGTYVIKKDTICCYDDVRKATFVFRRLDENLLLFLYSEKCHPLENKEVPYGDGTRLVSLYQELHTYFLLRHKARHRINSDRSLRLLNLYIWHDYWKKVQVYPRIRSK